MIATLIWLALVVGIILVWRCAPWPCPAWLVPLLENPYVEAVAGAKVILERAGICPDMRVLDAGCGPGRLTVPASIMVGPSGHVVAVDIQRRMLQMLRDRIEENGLTNVELVHAGLGEGRLAANEFDIALLVTVLGEIPNKVAALREIYECLRPGGVLSITEVLPDPHYQSFSRVCRLVADSGFRELAIFRGCLSYTLNVGKPAPDNPELLCHQSQERN
ncbi:MAG TPA: methyltransferase domain-containing protein [Terrimicrobiaceae bacterium]